MIVTLEDRSITLPPPIKARSEGTHVSGIIRAIATETGILDAKWADEISLTDVREITDPSAILRISIGLAWEAWYIPQSGINDHPEEMQVDGIYMTHDGDSIDVIITPKGKKNVLFVDEIKATYKSTKTVGDMESSSNWMWLTQIKAYCKGAKTCHARMHVLFICGDYSYPITPQLKVWRVEFTQKEIDENWSLMTDYRDQRIKIERER